MKPTRYFQVRHKPTGKWLGVSRWNPLKGLRPRIWNSLGSLRLTFATNSWMGINKNDLEVIEFEMVQIGRFEGIFNYKTKKG